MKLNLTFDLDLTDYQSGVFVDEPREFMEPILSALHDCGIRHTTWFVRLDSEAEHLYGGRKTLVREASDIVSLLISQGHEVGWHHHATGAAFTDEVALKREILDFGDVAMSLGLSCVRSGYGQMTNEVMRALGDFGFQTDSSCISRPNYPWEHVPLRDWTGAPNRPYRPCGNDFTRECVSESTPMVEVPITTVRLSWPTDTIPTMRRYLNPAYELSRFEAGIQSFTKSDDHGEVLVTVTHPYETKNTGMSTFGGNLDSFSANVRLLKETGFDHVPLSELR